MAFVGERNTHLAPKFAAIADAYRDLGQAWQVRWDYAFFQMVLETNYLQFRRGDGSFGDVALSQNNFAGVGATGGGVPGDRFPDVRTGVLAHIQHLVAYSGERVDRPVAERTRAYQGDIIEISRKLGRPVTFADLSHRWASDRAYGRNIEVIADFYRKAYCHGTTAASVPQQTWARPSPPRPAVAMAPPNRLGAPLPPSDEIAAPAPVEVQHKPRPLVRTIWREGDPDRKSAHPVPKPVEVRRPASVKTQAVSAAQPSDQPAPPAAGAGAQDVPTPSGNNRVAGFALAAQAAGAAAAGIAPRVCRIAVAEGGEGRIVLVRSRSNGEDTLTPVSSATASDATVAGMVAERMPGAEIVGVYDGYEPALVEARRLCPRG